MPRSPKRASPAAILDLLTGEIRELTANAGGDLYAIGVRLTRIRDERLWQGRRYASFDDYLDRAVDFSRSTAYKLVRVAREFNASIAQRYGMEKLEAGLRYLAATPVEERPGDLLAAAIRVRGDRGRFDLIPFHEATVAQINTAIHLLRAAKIGGWRIPKTVRARVEQFAADLPEPPPGARVRDRVPLRRSTDGRVMMSIHAFALDDIPAVIRALRKHLA